MKKQLYIAISLLAGFLIAGTMNGVETGEFSPVKAILLCTAYAAAGFIGLIKSGAFKY